MCNDVHGTAYTDLTTAEKARVNGTIDDGLRQFYRPPAVGGGKPWSWSFMYLTSTITQVAPYTTGTITVVDGVVTLSGGTFPAAAASYRLSCLGLDHAVSTRDSGTQLTLVDTTLDVSAGTTYSLHLDDHDLPADFGYLINEEFSYEPPTSMQPRMRVVSEGDIRTYRQLTSYSASTYPYCCAVRAKANVAATGTRSQILFWPSVSQSAILTYKYFSRPNTTAIGATGTEYVDGISDHSQTVMASVRAAAELSYDGQRGVHWQNFMSCLESSIQTDKQQNRPLTLGRRESGWFGSRHTVQQPVIYEGHWAS